MLLNALEVSIETGRSKEKIGTTWERGGEGGGLLPYESAPAESWAPAGSDFYGISDLYRGLLSLEAIQEFSSSSSSSKEQRRRHAPPPSQKKMRRCVSSVKSLRRRVR